MNQAMTGVVIAAVLAACWLLGRPRPKLLSSTDTAAVAALNRGQMELVLADPAAAATLPSAPVDQSWPRDARGRQQLLAQLEQHYRAGGQARQSAMAACLAWNNRAALPLIRRGLRDTDTQVVALAAQAMERFRGRSSAPLAVVLQAAKRPRNVSRMR
jgi:hypothetical protein